MKRRGAKTTRLRSVRSRAAGLTLLELILVMVLICTVLAMAAPSLRGFFASRQTSEAAAQIVALTEFARSQAVSEGRVYRLNLDETDNRYWLTAQTGGAFTTLDSRFSRVFQLPDGTSARWEEPIDAALRGWISFYPDGRTEAARIRLAGRQGEIVDIACLSPAERFGAVVPAAGEVR